MQCRTYDLVLGVVAAWALSWMPSLFGFLGLPLLVARSRHIPSVAFWKDPPVVSGQPCAPLLFAVLADSDYGASLRLPSLAAASALVAALSPICPATETRLVPWF